jgi:hypothetical protein
MPFMHAVFVAFLKNILSGLLMGPNESAISIFPMLPEK